jgi:hypothetical protein
VAIATLAAVGWLATAPEPHADNKLDQPSRLAF